MLARFISLAVGLALVPAACTRAKLRQDASPGKITPLTKAWQRAIEARGPPEGLEGLRASGCGTCHAEVYAEWKATPHARALQDLQFQAEWNKDDKLWLCINCHAPLADQMERAVVGLEDGDFRRPVTRLNPSFDPLLREESITCAACHVRDGAVLSVNAAADPGHPLHRRPRAFFVELCERCHNMQDRLTDVLVCTFSTGDEWRASGRAARGEDCIDCHMPPVTRERAEGVRRPGRRHTWFGAGIAKVPEDLDEVLAAYRPGYDIDLSVEARGTHRAQVVSISMSITNVRAGHELPTGDPERFITLELALRDASGTPLWTHTERIGEVWQWYPRAERRSDDSLRPGEHRQYVYEVPVPAEREASALVLVARNHRMTPENASAMGLGGGGYPLAVDVLRKEIAVAPRR